MGAQIGCGYALGGHEVVLHARDVAGARERAEAGLALLVLHELRTSAEVTRAAERLSTEEDPAVAAAGASLVVESLPEDLVLKATVLREALEAAPAATVATNTSS